MKKLTETLIKQRVRSCVTDIEKIVQINLTGRELEDVSLLRKMTNVEILSLSFNKIASLADFQQCENLKELYLRRNNITDLNQIQYLKNLSKLEMLMLSENPIANDPKYRSTIIKNLSNLQSLDGVQITPEERREATKCGKDVRTTSKSRFPSNNDLYISDGPQIHRTPPASTQKIKLLERAQSAEGNKIISESVEDICDRPLPAKEEKNALLKNISKNNVNLHSTTSSLYALGTGKSSRQISRNDSKKCLSKSKDSKMTSCKHCKNQPIDTQVTANMDVSKPSRRPKTTNTNILSASLSLVKELDYSGLQIVNAEILSRLNNFEVEFLYNMKPQP